MLNFEAARTNMVESQVRPNGITDVRILEAMISIAREDFVPADRRSVAYMDVDILISGEVHKGAPRYLMEPMVFARLMLPEPAKARPCVGCGSGYGTAVLARLAVRYGDDGWHLLMAASTLRQQAAAMRRSRHALRRAMRRGPYNVILIEGGAWCHHLPDNSRRRPPVAVVAMTNWHAPCFIAATAASVLRGL
jgi:protein-L-isoaspartate(D-aspartate) O-methyltransferase